MMQLQKLIGVQLISLMAILPSASADTQGVSSVATSSTSDNAWDRWGFDLKVGGHLVDFYSDDGTSKIVGCSSLGLFTDSSEFIAGSGIVHDVIFGLSLQLELAQTCRGAEIDNSATPGIPNTETELRYIDVTFAARREWQLGDKWQIHVVAGPSLAILRKANIIREDGRQDLTDSFRGNDVMILAGAGVSRRLFRRLHLTIESRGQLGVMEIGGESRNYSFSPLLVGVRWGGPMKSPIGDLDRDGFADRDDLCPEQHGVERWSGCPDDDGDQVPEKYPDAASANVTIDRCPDEPGTIAAQGCPDADNDGVADKDDACLNTAGDPANRDQPGCPTLDSDDGSVVPDEQPDTGSNRTDRVNR